MTAKSGSVADEPGVAADASASLRADFESGIQAGAARELIHGDRKLLDTADGVRGWPFHEAVKAGGLVSHLHCQPETVVIGWRRISEVLLPEGVATVDDQANHPDEHQRENIALPTVSHPSTFSISTPPRNATAVQVRLSSPKGTP